METEGLSFPEAVEKLASEAGLALPKMTPQDQARRSPPRFRAGGAGTRRAGSRPSSSSPKGAGAAISPTGASARRCEGVPARLRSTRTLRAARLSRLEGRRRPDDDRRPAFWCMARTSPFPDRFPHRIMFRSPTGRRIIAFGGRAMDGMPGEIFEFAGDQLFHKGHCLYNHHARERRS